MVSNLIALSSASDVCLGACKLVLHPIDTQLYRYMPPRYQQVQVVERA
jgi:hypothetical protein